MVTTSAAPVDMLELLGSAIVTAKKRAAVTRTTQTPGKLTMQRFTGASSLAGAAAVFCWSVAACFLIFCLVTTSFTVDDFLAVCSAFVGSCFRSGIMNESKPFLAWISPSCTREGLGLHKGMRREKRSAASRTEER